MNYTTVRWLQCYLHIQQLFQSLFKSYKLESLSLLELECKHKAVKVD